MTQKLLIAICLAGLVAAACGKNTTSSTTGPSAGTLAQLAGSWASTNPVTPSPLDSCSNFTWKVTDMTATSGAGAFTATCLGVMVVTGTARGTVSGGNVNWTVTANGTRPDTASCAINLTGTVQVQSTQLVINWNGTSCFGPLNGTEVLKRA